MIPVTKSFIPPIEEYTAQVQRAFDNGWLTNRGELVMELEEKLSKYLELEESRIICMNNGTIPLQIALKLLGNEGEIITTPFSYVATTAAIVWENCTPIFVDIDPVHLTIDETKIEAAITDKTTCILATHVFGNPCNVDEIDRIAKKHRLKVIYDAAHCFGVEYKGKSIFEYGDISTCSFHATKLFHTGEGGAIFCKNKDLYNRIFQSHNFGHKGYYSFYGLGINGKMSELQAAMGLTILNHISQLIEKRRFITSRYQEKLNIGDQTQMIVRQNTIWNSSYFPVVFPSEKDLLKCISELNEIGIHPRRYFFPSLCKLPYLNFQGQTEISIDISSRILCLPLYHDLTGFEVDKIALIVNKFL